MPLRVGFHLEGWDHLIVRAFLARALDLAEEELDPDQVDLASRGWHSIVHILPAALRRFYYSGAHLAVVGIDNDGNHDLGKTGALEDPQYPRHWNHSAPDARCRFCQLDSIIRKTRQQWKDLPQQPAATWPVLIVVPVESIEAWLLTLRALQTGQSGIYFEKEPRSSFKLRLYGRPAATRNDVEDTALPLVRSATKFQFQGLLAACRSFALFAAQVDAARQSILHPRQC